MKQKNGLNKNTLLNENAFEILFAEGYLYLQKVTYIAQVLCVNSLPAWRKYFQLRCAILYIFSN